MKNGFKVTFYKEVFQGMKEKKLEKVTFIYGDHKASMFDAYDEAVKRGHNPEKVILVERI